MGEGLEGDSEGLVVHYFIKKRVWAQCKRVESELSITDVWGALCLYRGEEV